ncbi:MAG: hypothetical protein RBS80_25015 [Thermoguttaceae bacterium]|jgi:hypothetical protein|nr:hypothetical protein [Thermoguttaceae bacterium]
MAAYLARRRFGHPAGEIAVVLGYRTASSVTRAVARIESGSNKLDHAATKLENVPLFPLSHFPFLTQHFIRLNCCETTSNAFWEIPE